jgi:hypothetical protein
VFQSQTCEYKTYRNKHTLAVNNPATFASALALDQQVYFAGLEVFVCRPGTCNSSPRMKRSSTVCDSHPKSTIEKKTFRRYLVAHASTPLPIV